MKNQAELTISADQSPGHDAHLRLLKTLATELKNRGLDCTEPEYGHYCAYCIATVDDNEVIVKVLPFETAGESQLRSYLVCTNYCKVNWRKRLFLPIRLNLDGGDAVAQVCAVLKNTLEKIIAANCNLLELKWTQRS